MTEHNVKVVAGYRPVVNGTTLSWAARSWGACSCGWVGTPWESRELAQASANGHFVFPEMVVTK